MNNKPDHYLALNKIRNKFFVWHVDKNAGKRYCIHAEGSHAYGYDSYHAAYVRAVEESMKQVEQFGGLPIINEVKENRNEP